ncbi:MAG: hypothetical protein OER88_10550 [Planctomycetota bacterium]|nr:hypothetical protein [Planctomycetota bacterium]
MLKTLTLFGALLLTASLAHAQAGVLQPGENVMIGNLHIANLQGAGGAVNYIANGTNLTLIVHDDAVCAALKKGTRPQSHDVYSLVLGGGYYAQANVSGATIAVLGDNAVALSLALRARHRNNGNTIDLLGNGNIAAAVRWCFGTGECLMNKIRFGANPLFTGSRNDAYLCGDRQGTRDLLWANRSLDVAGTGNRTIAWDGFKCEPAPDDEIEPAPVDVAVDANEIDADQSDTAVAVER